MDGIPTRMSALTKANKVLSRARWHKVRVDLPTEPLGADELGQALLALASRAQAAGLDPEQALRDRVRELEATIRRDEEAVPPPS